MPRSTIDAVGSNARCGSDVLIVNELSTTSVDEAARCAVEASAAAAQAQLANLLVSLSRKLGLSLLLISHDLAIVRHVADRVSVMYLGVMVEDGATQPLWELPLHPYTEALIGAVPHPDGAGFLPEALPGEVPDPGNPPSGCRFHPRCPYAFERCPEEEPPLVALADGRLAACWLQPAGAQPRQLENAARVK